LIQVLRVDNGMLRWLDPQAFTSTTYNSLPFTDGQPGPAYLIPFSNAMVGTAQMTVASYRIYLPVIKR